MAPDFDKFMVEEDLGGNEKIGRLTDAEFRVLITGVWAIASKARPRGYLVVAATRATDDDIARKAHKSLAIVRSTLKKLRAMDMVEEGENGFEYIHDWHQINPDPKRDTSAAKRKRDQRARERSERDSHAGVTP